MKDEYTLSDKNIVYKKRETQKSLKHKVLLFSSVPALLSRRSTTIIKN